MSITDGGRNRDFSSMIWSFGRSQAALPARSPRKLSTPADNAARLEDLWRGSRRTDPERLQPFPPPVDLPKTAPRRRKTDRIKPEARSGAAMPGVLGAWTTMRQALDRMTRMSL